MRFITAIAAAAFVLATANAASTAPLNTDTSAPIQLSQAKPKESPAAEVEQGKKGTAGPAEQIRPEMKNKEQMSGSSPNQKK